MGSIADAVKRATDDFESIDTMENVVKKTKINETKAL